MGSSLRFEKLEERLTLSLASGWDSFPAVDPFAMAVGNDSNRVAYVEAQSPDGDSREAAIDLGAIDGTRAVNGYVGGTDRVDYYRFELTQTAEVDLALAGLQQDIDLYLLDATGGQLARSIRPGNQSEVLGRTLAAGEYFIKVVPFGSNAGSYRLTLEALPAGRPPAGDDGNTFDDARRLGSLTTPTTLEESVGGEDPADYYRFRLDADAEVDIRLTGLGADVDLYLFGSDRRELARSWNGGSRDESLHLSLDAGEYVVLVKPWGGAESTYLLGMQAELKQPDTDPLPGPPPAEDGPYPDVDDFGGADDWNLNSIQAPEVWAQGFTGEGVVVAVVDTGVDGSHPELSSRMWVNPGEIPGNVIDDDGNGFIDDVYGWDFVGSDNDPADANGHGTHVAGIIAAANDGIGATGVAFGATIMPVRVLDANGAGSFYDVAAGIRYAVDNGAQVINLSLGGSYSSAVHSALAYAGQHSVFVVAAAGNEGAVTPVYPAAFGADLTHVLSVGAHDSNNTRAYFSNGVGTSGAVQVAAPGVGVLSCLPGNRYSRLSGTSMAAPHVAGLAALALSANPTLDPQTLRSLIVEGADRAIAGSDASGGVNGALTVARAERHTSAGYTQPAATATAPDGLPGGTFAQIHPDRRDFPASRPAGPCSPDVLAEPPGSIGPALTSTRAVQFAIDAIFGSSGLEPWADLLIAVT